MLKNFLRQFASFKFIKYAVVGLTCTSLDFLLLYIFTEFLHIFYLLSAVLSIAVVLWLSFSLNKYWTFADFGGQYFKQFFGYILSHMLALILSLIILTVLVEIFGLWYILARAVGTGLAAVINFSLTKKYVFNNQKK